LCDQVTVILDLRRRTVLRRGTLEGSRTKTPAGGQAYLVSATTLKLEWKNVQKNLKKNRTSELMNQIIAIRRLTCTGGLWNPLRLASRLTSRHQNPVTKTVATVLAAIPTIDLECIKSHRLDKRRNPDIADMIGQGDASTK
jgi:hypothetical protein